MFTYVFINQSRNFRYWMILYDFVVFRQNFQKAPKSATFLGYLGLILTCHKQLRSVHPGALFLKAKT